MVIVNHNAIAIGNTSSAITDRTSETDKIVDLECADDGHWMVYAHGRKATVFDLRTKRRVQELVGHSDNVTSVAVNPNGRRIVTGSLDGTVRLWDSSTGQEILRLADKIRAFGDVVWSRDGRFVAAGTALDLYVWDCGSRFT
jgi:WD40 repeat protein